VDGAQATARFLFAMKRPEASRVRSGGKYMSTTIATKEWLTVADLCQLLGIGRTLAYQLIAEHTIPAVRIGRAVRVRKADIEEWLEDNRY